MEDALNVLRGSIEFHNTEEEALMKAQDYPGYESHRKKHELILNELLEIQEQFKKNGSEINEAFLDFFKRWIITDILTLDRNYGHFLNKKGLL